MWSRERNSTLFLGNTAFCYLKLKKAIQKEVSRGKKISLLTAAPKSWTKIIIMRFFGVTESMVHRARKLRELGILSDPSPKLARPVSVKTAITDFYTSDDVLASGKKGHTAGSSEEDSSGEFAWDVWDMEEPISPSWVWIFHLRSTMPQVVCSSKGPWHTQHVRVCLSPKYQADLDLWSQRGL